MTYQHVIALIVPNTVVMPALDLQTFYSNPQQTVNYMNCSQYDGDDIEILRLRFKEMFKTQPKFRYALKKIAGDYYYEKLTIDEALERVFLKPESDDKILRS